MLAKLDQNCKYRGVSWLCKTNTNFFFSPVTLYSRQFCIGEAASTEVFPGCVKQLPPFLSFFSPVTLSSRQYCVGPAASTEAL